MMGIGGGPDWRWAHGPDSGDEKYSEGLLICGMEEAATVFMSPERRRELREEELVKLEEMGVFAQEPRPKPGTKILYPRWVDTADKSRLTCADLKSRGAATGLTHCPTPSMFTNLMFEAMAAIHGWSTVFFDVVSAFLHAWEDNQQVYMMPPKEWFELRDILVGSCVWRMVRSLYGRRTAGANFRDAWEQVLLGYEVNGERFQRGTTEPCVYTLKSAFLTVSHHVDDGRIMGPRLEVLRFLEYLKTKVLLKCSPVLSPGCSCEHLGDLKIRTRRGWVTVPNPKHLEQMLQATGIKESGKSVRTPGVKREPTENEKEVLDDAYTSKYRSAVGSLIYLSRCRPDVLYSTKELARGMAAPTKADWMDLTRVTKFLLATRNRITVMETAEAPTWPETAKEAASRSVKLELQVFSDADWAGSRRDYRSTSGTVVKINGLMVACYSNTQAGVPALSSGESELRALSRAATESMYARRVLMEMGMECVPVLFSDASAALSNAERLGPGRMRHLMVSAMYVKELVRRRFVRLQKIDTRANVSDIFTKHVSSETLEKLLPGVGLSDEQPPPNQQVSLEKLNCLDDVPHLREKGSDLSKDGDLVAGVLEYGMGALGTAACIGMGWCLARWRQFRARAEAEVQVDLAVDPETPQIPNQIFMSGGPGGQCFHCNPGCFGLRSAPDDVAKSAGGRHRARRAATRTWKH
jgi:hypothetical protein